MSASMGMVASVLLMIATWRLSGGHWLAVLLVAAVPGVSLEGAQGLETVAFAALVTAALGRSQHWAWWAGVAAWVSQRVLVSGVLWLLRRGGETAHSRELHRWDHRIRLAYYGDIVPNTFHAKVGGVPVWRGLRYLAEFGTTAGPLLVLGLAGAILAPGGGGRIPRSRPLCSRWSMWSMSSVWAVTSREPRLDTIAPALAQSWRCPWSRPAAPSRWPSGPWRSSSPFPAS